jgi:hypothetical protein
MDDHRAAVLKKCISEIEQKLGWGDSASWSDRDFDQLSELINSRTSVLLSQITLKRLWGRIHYPHSPSIATLDALAKFCGYENWRECAQPIPNPNADKVETEKPGYIKSRKVWVILIALPILALLVFFFSTSSSVSKNELIINPTTATGVPVKIDFKYQLVKKPLRTAFIWPTWEQKDLIKLEDQKGSVEYVYHYPGFYRTKLTLDGLLLKEQDLQINTNGWLACVEQPTQPLYFQKHDFVKNGFLEIEDGLLPRYGIPFRPVTPLIRFFYIADFKGLMNDNFDFETDVKSTFESGSTESEYIEVIIHCKDDALIIPVCTKENISNAYLYMAGTEMRGQEGDLTNFYADIREWVNIKVNVKNKDVTISLNDNSRITTKLHDQPAEIVGVQIRFTGAGSIRRTRLASMALN